MNTLVITIALLCLPMASIAQKVSLEIKIVPIIAPKEAVEARFDGAVLTMAKGDQKAAQVRLSAKNQENIRKAILAVPTKQWNGYWASLNYLDGSILLARLELDGEKFEFRGTNGCPPKFSRILAAIYEASKERIFAGGWEEMGKSAKRYESYDDFIENTFKTDKNKQD
jgi:hypothetical protein